MEYEPCLSGIQTPPLCPLHEGPLNIQQAIAKELAALANTSLPSKHLPDLPSVSTAPSAGIPDCCLFTMF